MQIPLICLKNSCSQPISHPTTSTCHCSSQDVLDHKELWDFFTADRKHELMKKIIGKLKFTFHFSSVQSLSHVRLTVIPWTAAWQASLSITNSRSLLKLMSIKLVMPSNHLILCRPLLLLPFPPSFPPSLSQNQDLSHWVSSLHQMAKEVHLYNSYLIKSNKVLSGTVT